MLGMMNCPTENSEFYSASPLASRQIQENGAVVNAESKDFPVRRSSSGLEVFSEPKPRPQISYTAADGRRLTDGKLMEEAKEPREMWNRVIVDSFTARQLQHPAENGRKAVDGDEFVVIGGEQSSSEEPSVQEETPKQKRSFSLYGFLPKMKARKTSYTVGSQKTQFNRQQKS